MIEPKPSWSTGKAPPPQGRGRPKKNTLLAEVEFCCVCAEILPNLLSNKKCAMCALPAHTECTRPGPIWVCHSCDAESSEAEIDYNGSSDDYDKLFDA